MTIANHLNDVDRPFEVARAYFIRAIAWLAAARDRIARRRQFKALLRYDPRMLDDMGLTPEDVAWGLGQPLWVDAARAVEARAGSRRKAELSVRLSAWRGGLVRHHDWP